MEVPYVFGTTGGRFGFDGSAELAATICDLWVDFARDGLVEGWATADSEDLVTFTNAGPVMGVDPWTRRLDAVEEGYARVGRSATSP